VASGSHRSAIQPAPQLRNLPIGLVKLRRCRQQPVPRLCPLLRLHLSFCLKGGRQSRLCRLCILQLLHELLLTPLPRFSSLGCFQLLLPQLLPQEPRLLLCL
jgi:hypothetical protein